MHSTAETIVPCPVRMTTGTSGQADCILFTRSSPSAPGILRSVRTTSTGDRASEATASATLPLRSTSKPRCPSSSPREERTYASSSTTRTRPRAGRFSGMSQPSSPSGDGRLRRWEAQPEDRAASIAIQDSQVATVLRDDRVADRKPEPGRVLGRVERLEDARPVLPRDAGAAVGDLRDHPLLLAPRAHTHLTPRGLSLAGVQDQVHEHLSQERLASLHAQRLGGKILLEADRSELGTRPHEIDRLQENAAQVEDDAWRGCRIGVLEHLAHDVSGPPQPLLDHLQPPRRGG